MIRVGSGLASPDDSDAHKQRSWDKAVVDAEFSQLFNKYTEPNNLARLLAAVAPHSGDWLHTVPISAYGLHLDDSAIRVAVGLRLGCALCEAHQCPCGATADPLGDVGLLMNDEYIQCIRH